jgi:hypothetical protein
MQGRKRADAASLDTRAEAHQGINANLQPTAKQFARNL